MRQGTKIAPALLGENESPGALGAGNKARRPAATSPLAVLNARPRVHPSLSRARGAQRGYGERGSSLTLSLGHWSGLCFIDWSQIHGARMGKEESQRAPARGQVVSQVTEIHALCCFNPGNDSPRERSCSCSREAERGKAPWLRSQSHRWWVAPTSQLGSLAPARAGLSHQHPLTAGHPAPCFTQDASCSHLAMEGKGRKCPLSVLSLHTLQQWAPGSPLPWVGINS